MQFLQGEVPITSVGLCTGPREFAIASLATREPEHFVDWTRVKPSGATDLSE
jgi:hypothetical protein